MWFMWLVLSKNFTYKKTINLLLELNFFILAKKSEKKLNESLEDFIIDE